MLLSPLNFLFFFLLISWLFFLIPSCYRLFLILSASFLFYLAFRPIYIFVLVFIIVVTFCSARLIEKSKDKRKFFLITGIIIACLPLIFFKYFNFINENIKVIFQFFYINYSYSELDLILPIGLSFYSFQGLSYLIEVYKKKQKPLNNIWVYSSYIAFYPKLLAGPIERPQNLIRQFFKRKAYSYRRTAEGLKLMTWGLFKKIVIADHLAILVNHVYGNPYDWPALYLFLTTFFFAFQIYCDFSAYTDLGIGAAQIMGFKLTKNFNKPYFSASVSEFWRRWHISLSSWFRDYIYIPLGGNRVSGRRWCFNLTITFLVAGLWHGANWTYVFWGLLNSFYLMVSVWVKSIMHRLGYLPKAKRKIKILQILFTFSLITFSWIFFRANNMTEGIYIAKKIIESLFQFVYYLITANIILLQQVLQLSKNNIIPLKDLFLAFSLIVFLIVVEISSKDGNLLTLVSKKPALIRWGVYYFFILIILCFGMFGENQFIYFKF